MTSSEVIQDLTVNATRGNIHLEVTGVSTMKARLGIGRSLKTVKKESL